MALKFSNGVAKGLKLKFRKFWGLAPTFVEIIGGKLVVRGGPFCTPPSSIGLRANLWKVVLKYENVMFLTFGPFFSKCTFLRCRYFFSTGAYPIKLMFSVVKCIYKIYVFYCSIFLLANIAKITEEVSFFSFVGKLPC